MSETAVATWTLGIADEEFFQRKPKAGLITKCEVRVVALSKMGVRPDSVVWDIGAGSWSVGVEAALLAPRGQVFAIEKNAEDFGIIQQNIAKFGTTNLTAVLGNGPDGTESWPDPDAVFVGGSGGRMDDIVSTVAQRLRPGGRFVIDAATIENLAEAVRLMKEHGFAVDVTLALRR
ncbi:MAG: precorrin-6Y C5,15-methyltransferase (decarboxylating) subunit CbiT [Chloroflexi bacterium]|nr:precorrin-6Y C5,15-methyltransferase (decarboxylating) subunit CbiT [Chloroflexota bacterium]